MHVLEWMLLAGWTFTNVSIVVLARNLGRDLRALHAEIRRVGERLEAFEAAEARGTSDSLKYQEAKAA